MKHKITIQNLKCGGCANTIIKKVSLLSGISDVEVNNDSDLVSFNAETEEGLTVVVNKLKTLGYPPSEEVNSIASKAKSFISCASGRINK